MLQYRSFLFQGSLLLKVSVQLNWDIFHSNSFPPPLHSVPNATPLHYKLIQLYPRIRLFLSSFLKVDQIYIKPETIYTHKATFETKQNILLAKRLMNTDFLPYFWCSHSVLVLARASQAKHLINKWRTISESKLLKEKALSSSCSEKGARGIQ